jgi:hypothetical protein
LLAAVAVVLAGCGSGATSTTHTGPPHTTPVTLVGTTTVAHMPTGTPIHCKHGPGAEVPRTEEAVVGFADGQTSSGSIEVTHRQDGPVVASCRSG